MDLANFLTTLWNGQPSLESVLSTAGKSLFFCQGLKFVLGSRKEQTSAWRRLLEPGGMPSSHSAVVTTLATMLGRTNGWTSPIFQLATIFGVIVIYDALTIRRAVGEHARLLNLLKARGIIPEEIPLPERLGHTPIEVLAGMGVGFFLASVRLS